jgi:glucose/mannose transport system substrate-binding protein
MMRNLAVSFLALGANAAVVAAPPTPTVVAAPPTVEVIHWWTSGGESAAIKSFADAYRAAGGVWHDSAIAGSEQARAVAISRILGGNPPSAALFNASKQFLDLDDQGLLNSVDEVASRQGWDQVLPETILSAVKIRGHYYAAPVDIHMPTWIWYSKAAFRKAGIAAEPATFPELLAALGKLKAASLIGLAQGGQAWQESVVFRAVLANVGGRDLYLSVFRDRDPRALKSDALRNVLLNFKRLQSYVDDGSPGRNWNDATALLITGRAGVQIMGDWVKAEFAAAHQVAGRDYGCIAGFGAHSPYIVQGDVLVFPKTADPEGLRAQQLLARVVTEPRAQVAFSQLKGSIPIRSDVDASQLDVCAQQGLAILRDRTRQVGNDEIYLTPDQNGALADVLSEYWNRNLPVETVQGKFAAALSE